MLGAMLQFATEILLFDISGLSLFCSLLLLEFLHTRCLRTPNIPKEEKQNPRARTKSLVFRASSVVHDSSDSSEKDVGEAIVLEQFK